MGQIFEYTWMEKIVFVKLFWIEGSQGKKNTCIDVSRGQDAKYMLQTMHMGAMRQEKKEDVAILYVLIILQLSKQLNSY